MIDLSLGRLHICAGRLNDRSGEPLGLRVYVVAKEQEKPSWRFSPKALSFDRAAFIPNRWTGLRP